MEFFLFFRVLVILWEISRVFDCIFFSRVYVCGYVVFANSFFEQIDCRGFEYKKSMSFLWRICISILHSTTLMKLVGFLERESRFIRLSLFFLTTRWDEIYSFLIWTCNNRCGFCWLDNLSRIRNYQLNNFTYKINKTKFNISICKTFKPHNNVFLLESLLWLSHSSNGNKSSSCTGQCKKFLWYKTLFPISSFA
jgi:hypothetical protein